jgi:uncharacterized protein YrrD
MLHSIKALKKCAVYANDGEVGKISDAYFDDERWVLRHLVVDTGNWLTRHEVLLSPVSLGSTDWEHERVHMNLSRATIESSPSIDTHQPVSRQAEAAMARHFGIPYYRSGGGGKWNFDDDQLDMVERDIAAGNPEDRHLRSCNEVAGYAIGATDDQLGHVVDFLFDEDDWSVQYLVADPRDLWPGKHVLIPASRVENVDWADHKVMVDMRRDEVEHSQEYDPDHLPPPAAGHRIGAAIGADGTPRRPLTGGPGA